MHVRRTLVWGLLVLLGAAIVSFSATNPRITVSATKIQSPGYILVKGSGFTPNQNVSSHLRKPAGDEYPALPILTDKNGQFTHDIDTRLLPIGVHELWVVDDTSKKSSNHIRFEVTAP